jgi:transcriptional regulator with XRE-family HTH domain
MTINNRIRILIELLAEGKQSRFAEKAGLNAAAINGIIGKKASDPTFSTLKKIIDAYPNIDVNWLMKGEGKPLIITEGQDENDVIPEPISEYQESLEKIKNSNYLCPNLRLIRTHLHLGQGAFAQIFGVTRDMIASYERGFKPKLPFLKSLMDYFSISLDELTACDLAEHPEILEKISSAEVKVKDKKGKKSDSK